MRPIVYTLDKGGVQDDEVQRLNAQHPIITAVTGSLMPHVVRKHLDALGRRPAVADIGTGTGIWLQSIAKDLPSDAQLDGYDISSTVFPKAPWQPANMRLIEANALEPFDDEVLGSYDVVHVRLMAYCLAREQWQLLARNLVPLLRPGGYIFWEECGYPCMTCVPLTKTFQKVAGLDARYAASMGRDVTMPSGLLRHLQNAGYTDLGLTTHDSFSLGDSFQKSAQYLIISALKQSMHGIVALGGSEWLRSDDDVERAVKQLYAEADELGCRYGFQLYHLVGRAPQSERDG
ncbi:hypothetical protein CDD82_188 [Ophiocordyceps australis]|uniref:Methyltransferase type 12 domain-containing protein n=1 Tax=Ophiocordyceps australis TaxID=1399860 RepID=A0A2C5YMI0_9HYPO|nr:hypothetical protein CDD82_188 [Ophiocordyceps australis]